MIPACSVRSGRA
uniref:Uncharacterized protein n=1 Tax=Arundo donax TaxID=35708 RepID=A0A0A9EM46_ARUDO